MEIQTPSLALQAFPSSFYFHMCASQGLLWRNNEALEPMSPLKYVHLHLKNGECCFILFKRNSAITYTISFLAWTNPQISVIPSTRAESLFSPGTRQYCLLTQVNHSICHSDFKVNRKEFDFGSFSSSLASH